jgi:phage terminase large subunit GpA-like protein
MTFELAEETVRLVDAAWRRGLAPEPQMTVSEWADRHRVLPPESAEPGPWRTSRVPYLREIQDSLSTASPIERVVVMKGAQVAGTEAGLNATGYWMQHAPGTILIVWPTIKIVRRNSRTRVDPLIAGTPALRSIVAPKRSREADNTVDSKAFPGGVLLMVGANAPADLRSTAARYLVLDEVDAYPTDVGEEGDPITLAIQRSATFAGRRKILMVSTPTIAGVSRIEKAFAESDQRRFHVPCPHCGCFQVLAWSGIRWPEGEPERAVYVCSECEASIAERYKPAMLAAGEWRATAAGDGRTRGYHVPALLSPFERWSEIAIDFLASRRDPVRLKTWVNLKLGEAYEDRETEPVAADALAARTEDFGPELPAGVALITAGVDTQDNRLEVEIVGWGRGEESWSIEYHVIHGDTASAGPWDALDRLLLRRFRHAKAVPDLPVHAVAIDSGGHRTGQVLAFSAARLSRRVWAIKGRGGPGIPPWPKRPPRPLPARMAPVHIVGVDGLKSALMARLRVADAAGPGVAHFPEDRDHDWFRGLLAERAVRKWSRGVARLEWVPDPGVRNEPLDCRVYATAALYGLAAAGVRLVDAAAILDAANKRTESPVKLTDRPHVARIKSRWIQL